MECGKVDDGQRVMGKGWRALLGLMTDGRAHSPLSKRENASLNSEEGPQGSALCACTGPACSPAVDDLRTRDLLYRKKLAKAAL